MEALPSPVLVAVIGAAARAGRGRRQRQVGVDEVAGLDRIIDPGRRADRLDRSNGDRADDGRMSDRRLGSLGLSGGSETGRVVDG